jgi:hypothetical protein
MSGIFHVTDRDRYDLPRLPIKGTAALFLSVLTGDVSVQIASSATEKMILD